jgi:dUTP pyrophosphatase
MLGQAVGSDLHAFLLDESGRGRRLILPPRNTRAIPTGLLIEPPPPDSNTVWTATVFSRSGLALKNIWVANAPGLIDPDYRGELKVLLYNGGLETQYIEHEQRIAQLVILQVAYVGFIEVEELTKTERDTRGMGSTG